MRTGTRWTIFDAASDAFYVNIADPAQMVKIPEEMPYVEVKELAALPGMDKDSAQKFFDAITASNTCAVQMFEVAFSRRMCCSRVCSAMR